MKDAALESQVGPRVGVKALGLLKDHGDQCPWRVLGQEAFGEGQAVDEVLGLLEGQGSGAGGGV